MMVTRFNDIALTSMGYLPAQRVLRILLRLETEPPIVQGRRDDRGGEWQKNSSQKKFSCGW
jgi:hypothetical protein